jgi:Protein of unknown function (DUF3616).
MRKTYGILGFVMGLAAGAAAQQAPPVALQQMAVDGRFIDGEGKAPATDISGMACMPPRGGRRICLAINDENRSAQFAAIDGDRLVVGQAIELFGKEPNPKPLGRPPDIACSEEGKFKDLDGEGVAYAEPYFYVVGAHGCARKTGKLHLSSFLLARVRVDRDGRPVDDDGVPVTADHPQRAVETTWRVSDLLLGAPRVRDFVARDLKTANGLNIEGIAVHGDTVWFGLRAPVDRGDAFLVRGSLLDLFRKGDDRAEVLQDAVPLALEGRGVRDLAALPGGRLLVLAGAAEGPEVPFKLFVFDPATRTLLPVATLPRVEQKIDGETVLGKAETVTVLETTPDGTGASVVVLFDSLIDGLPHRAQIGLPR